MNVDEQLPLVRDEIGLLGQFAGGGIGEPLAGDVDQAGRQLPQERAGRMAILTHEHHAALVVDGDNADGTLMDHEVALRVHATGHGDVVGDQAEHRPSEMDLAITDGVGVRRRLLAGGHAAPTFAFSTLTGNRPASEYASAAATRPSNNGWDRVGRLFNSGCACVATKYGCRPRSSSMNSTRCPSGDCPEKCSPASERRSRYALLTSYRCRWRSSTSPLP